MSKDALRNKWVPKTTDSNDNNRESNEPTPVNDTGAKPSKFYGVDTQSPFLSTNKFICRDGRVLFLPYSLQPIVEFSPENGITIKTMQKEVHIKGTGLRILADWLGAQRVNWVQESTTGTDDASEDIFVSSIEYKAAM